MSLALTTIATTVTTTTHDVTTADAFGGIVALIVAIVSFLSISGLALSMTIGASKSPGTMAITGIAGVLSVVVAVGLYMTITGTHAHKLEECPMATWDRIGSIIALLMGIVGFLALGGLAVVMMIGGFTPAKQPVTSWAPDQERVFAGFDQRIAASQSRAWMFSILAGVMTFIFIVGVYKGVKPDIKDITKDMNMSNLTKKSKSDPAPKAETPKAETPKAEDPAPKQ